MRHLIFLIAAAGVSCARLFSNPIDDLAKTAPAELVKQMTLEEKVGQLIHIGMAGKAMNPALKADIEKYHVGGVILFEINLGKGPEIKALTDSIQDVESKSPNAIPIFVSIDQEGGRVVRVKDGVEQFPGAAAIGQTGDEAMAHDAGFITAQDLSALGIPFVLAPVVDVNNNPANPVINTRSYGGDPNLVTRMALAYASGVMDASCIPALKHFPGHGNTGTDSHTSLPTVKQDLAQMDAVELVPYKEGIKRGFPVIMSAHIVFPALDPTEPATLSPKILKDFLRTKLGFQGLITTDALEMKAVADRYPPPVLARKAFTAGVDVLLLTSSGERTRLMFESLVDGFKKGELPMQDLDRAVERQIELKIRAGLFHKYKMNRPAWSTNVQEAFQEREEAQKKLRSEIAARYKDGLNRTISRASISSLRKAYNGVGQRADAKLFLRSPASVQQAQELGLEKQVTVSGFPVGSAAAVIAGFCRPGAQCPAAVIVELADFDLWRWNQLVAEMNDARKSNRTVPVLVGLYTGNPYLNVRVPSDGAVIGSFSPTEESLRALVYRAFEGGPVREARLVLADEK